MCMCVHVSVHMCVHVCACVYMCACVTRVSPNINTVAQKGRMELYTHQTFYWYVVEFF